MRVRFPPPASGRRVHGRHGRGRDAYGRKQGRYASLERLVAESGATAQDALGASTDGWPEGAHDPYRWLRFPVGVIVGGTYRELEERAADVRGRRSRTATLDRFLHTAISDAFTIDDRCRASPTVSDALIKADLNRQRWRAEGEVGDALRRGVSPPTGAYRGPVARSCRRARRGHVGRTRCRQREGRRTLPQPRA